MVTFTDVLNYYQNMGRLGIQMRIMWLVAIDRYEILEIDESRIIADSLTLERGSTTSDQIEIGNVISSELKFTLKNYDGFFDNVQFNSPDTRISVFLERKDMDVNENYPFNTRFDILCEGFQVVDFQRNINTISIVALDNLASLDNPVNWTNLMEHYNWYKSHEASKPPLGKYLAWAIGSIAWELNLNFTGLYTGTNGEMDVLGAINGKAITYRDLLKQLAFMNASNVSIDSFDPNYPNLLTVKGYSPQLYNRNYAGSEKSTTRKFVIDTSNKYSSNLTSGWLNISQFTYTYANNQTYVAGTETIGGYTMSYSGCELMEYVSNKQVAVNNIFNEITTWDYQPYEAVIKQNPFLMPMDRITFVEARTGETHDTIVTNQLYKFGGNTRIAGKGVSPKMYEKYRPSTVTQESTMKQIADMATKTQIVADNSMPPFDETFNEVYFNVNENNNKPTSAKHLTFQVPTNIKKAYIHLFASRGPVAGHTIFMAIGNSSKSITFHFPAYDAYAVVSHFMPIRGGTWIDIYTDSPNETWIVRSLRYFYKE